MNRNMQGYLHEQIDEAQKEEVQADARWKSKVDDILYEREDFAKPEEDEPQRIADMLNGIQGLKPTDLEQARRYYMRRGGKGALHRRWESLPSEVKARVFNNIPKWAQTALHNYVNFGSDWMENPAPGAGGSATTGSN